MTSGICQDFTPFNLEQPKRFANSNDNLDKDFYFYPTDTTINQDTIVFVQYLSQSDYYVDVTNTNCAGWGGGFQPTADTTWLGRNIYFDSIAKHLILYNFSNEEMVFDFSINQGDSSLFYSNGIDHFYLRLDTTAYELVIDSLDSVRTYTIWNYDGSGNLLASGLNGFQVKLSENLGLVSFIECNEFPQIEKGVELIGQLNPTIGYYQMTYDEAFPWDIGDTLEFRGYAPSRTSYNMTTIQSRVETTDSVWIYLNTHIQNQPDSVPPGFAPPYNIVLPNPIVFRKNTNIHSSPNQMFAGGTYYNDEIDTCGARNVCGFSGDFLHYEQCCDCFNPYDGHGTGIEFYKYTSGLGMTFKKTRRYCCYFDIYEANLIYSSIGGVQCGNYIPLTLSTEELEPTKTERKLIKIVDLLGRDVNIQNNMILIYIYDDGSIEKKYSVDQ
jgi:hypothetical protein